MTLRKTFFDEANELIVQFEQGLLNLEKEKDKTLLIGEIFRASHSLKFCSSSRIRRFGKFFS